MKIDWKEVGKVALGSITLLILWAYNDSIKREWLYYGVLACMLWFLARTIDRLQNQVNALQERIFELEQKAKWDRIRD